MVRTNKNRLWLENLVLIQREVDRIAALDFSAVSEDDRNFTLPNPSGTGRMLCGITAWKNVGTLAEELLKRSQLFDRVTPASARSCLEKVIVEYFWRDGRAANISNFDRALNEAASRLPNTCSTRTHFIPCHLMWAQEPTEIHIGPVRFLSRRTFRRNLTGKVRAYRHYLRNVGESSSKKQVLDVLAYYRPYRWIAEIEVNGCDAETSKQVAARAAVSALDCFQLLLGPQWTGKMRVGGPSSLVERQGRLSLDGAGHLSTTWSTAAIGHVNFAEGWSAALSRDDIHETSRRLGVAVEASVTLSEPRPLSRRFLDAAQWFGEAVREESASTSIIKYVIAIERLVMTEEREGIAERFVERVAALCFYPSEPGSRETWRGRATKLYDVRSQLVHGALSPIDRSLPSHLHLAATTAEQTLLGALRGFQPEDFRANKMRSRDISAWFTKIMLWADQVERKSEEHTPSYRSTFHGLKVRWSRWLYKFGV